MSHSSAMPSSNSDVITCVFLDKHDETDLESNTVVGMLMIPRTTNSPKSDFQEVYQAVANLKAWLMKHTRRNLKQDLTYFVTDESNRAQYLDFQDSSGSLGEHRVLYLTSDPKSDTGRSVENIGTAIRSSVLPMFLQGGTIEVQDTGCLESDASTEDKRAAHGIDEERANLEAEYVKKQANLAAEYDRRLDDILREDRRLLKTQFEYVQNMKADLKEKTEEELQKNFVKKVEELQNKFDKKVEELQNKFDKTEEELRQNIEGLEAELRHKIGIAHTNLTTLELRENTVQLKEDELQIREETLKSQMNAQQNSEAYLNQQWEKMRALTREEEGEEEVEALPKSPKTDETSKDQPVDDTMTVARI
ncbi:hypothetical protein FA95DRAFT_1601288 [Auriscalpium vulgare]|uniref:Uncharacterized protein n=1 Tax=Auriscalpium vulgare TaxID=40419 RepID=A0ACB8S9U6_9AGAM|nr:hypothetical protein FA95DRAFT_1601288 [Auriscalpium vulgare]